MKYPSKRVFVPAHYETIEFFDFGGNYELFHKCLEHPEHLHFALAIRENQMGLLLRYTAPYYSRDGFIAHTSITLRSYNLNFFRKDGETLIDTARRCVEKFNSKWNLNIQF